jgi:hypothetical protein
MAGAVHEGCKRLSQAGGAAGDCDVSRGLVYGREYVLNQTVDESSILIIYCVLW